MDLYERKKNESQVEKVDSRKIRRRKIFLNNHIGEKEKKRLQDRNHMNAMFLANSHLYLYMHVYVDIHSGISV